MELTLRSAIARFAIASAGPALIFAIGELYLRAFDPFPSYENEVIGAYPDQFDAALGWSGIPNTHRYFTRPEFKILIETNEMGFRDDSFNTKSVEARRRGNKRVLVLGDSFAWGWGVEAKARVGEQLEKLSHQITTFNLAQSGYGTDQQTLVFDRYAERIQPDLVILLFSTNDFKESLMREWNGQPKPLFAVEGGKLRLTNFPIPFNETYWTRKTLLAQQYGPDFTARKRGEPSGPLGAASRLLARKSQFFNWVRFKVDLILHPDPVTTGLKKLADALGPQEMARRERLALQRTSEVVFLLLAALDSRIDALDSRLLIALIPEKEQVLGLKPGGGWQQFFLSWCGIHGVACLDLLPHLKHEPRAYWRIDGHWNARGHRLAAEAIFEVLKNELPEIVGRNP